jgi:probable HAF family extracellular repeat protein
VVFKRNEDNIMQTYRITWAAVLGLLLGVIGKASAAFIPLGFLPGGDLSQALAVSADGKVVVGDSRSVASGSLGEAFRWTQTSGMVGLGDLPGGQFASQAFDVSANGSVVVGRSESGQFNFEAFRWTQATGMLGLGFIQGSLAPINASSAEAVSPDGSVVVGSNEAFGGVGRQAFRWTQATGMVGLGRLPGGTFSEATDISADGSVIVGQSETFASIDAFRWTQAGGMVSLGHLPGGTQSASVAVSADGSLVVGRDIIGGPTDFEAFIWDGTNGMRNLREVLIAQGDDLTGWSLSEARGISADGRIIIGFGINPEGNREAWLAELTPQQVVPEPVAIDVKPGSSENPINPRSNGVISIAILSTNSFDPSTVDQASVEFGPNQALATGRGQLQDVNGDGLPDLVLHFRTQDSGIQCGDTSVSITGQTVDGTPIQGSDSITTVGCKPVAADQKKK